MWIVTYRAPPTTRYPKGHEIVIHTITRPPKTKVLRVAGGRRKFIAVKVSRPIKEFIIYAPESRKELPQHHAQYRAPKGTKNKMGKKNKQVDEVTDNDLEELESLEDVVDSEPDEDEDEAPTPKKTKKGKKGKKASGPTVDEDEAPKKKRGGAAPGKSRAAANGKVGTAEIAAAGGCDARTLRMVLRKHEIPKDDETGRYEWASMKDPTVKKILKLLKDGEADKVKTEGLQRLKDSKAAKDAEAKTADTKKGKKDKKKTKK